MARGVGMIITVEKSDTFPYPLQVSTCSVTLVDADKIITAGHCHQPDEALSSSVIFDYLTECLGGRPGSYNPRFYKVKKVIGHKNTGPTLDYSLLQLAEAPAGIPIIQMRHDVPAPPEQVFGIHHPNGAVKKLSLPHAAGFATVAGNSSVYESGAVVVVASGFDVLGGSLGWDCSIPLGASWESCLGVIHAIKPRRRVLWRSCPTKNILADLVPGPPPPVTRDVMLVFDRSGSMSMDDGTGRQKSRSGRRGIPVCAAH